MALAGVTQIGGAKKLNEMNRLGDMAHFPPLVNAGATINVLLTLWITWWLAPRHPQPYAPVLWVTTVLTLNLLPVLVLRLTMGSATHYPPMHSMDFFRDQHKFSDWVYLAASANMAFWVLVSWALFSIEASPRSLLFMLTAAFLITFSPVLMRFSRSEAK